MNARMTRGIVASWVRLYTHGLPAATAQRRREEVAADVADQIDYETGRGTTDSRIVMSVLSRLVRGMASDVAWRTEVSTQQGGFMKVLIGTLVVGLALAAIAFVLDSPLVLLVSVAVIGAVILGVFGIGLQTAQRMNLLGSFLLSTAATLAVAALGVIAVFAGERGDAPGLVLLGITIVTCVVLGAYALGVRTAQRSN